ncbi:MAG: OB-fold domain-containing protein [Aquamicrobium sp.]|nr:OB-fold domain-containing protein [Aquamicrobium sp.]
MRGITGFGAYVPRLRLTRGAVAQAHSWNGGRGGKPPAGERAMCNWDEDVITMAVEAARDGLHPLNERGASPDFGSICLASTSLPHADRQNAGIVAMALNLGEQLNTTDMTGSQRAGTSALLGALQADAGPRQHLVIASEHRGTRAGAPHETRFGDGAAAFTLGCDNVIAKLLGSETISLDFVDHFRASEEKYDYYWEERWIRDEGVMKILPRAIQAALANTGLSAQDIDHVILPAPVPQARQKIVAKMGFREEALVASHEGTIGDTGAAHPLLMLAEVLARAKPEQTILLASFGQGSDVIILRTTELIGSVSPRLGLNGAIARRRAVEDYGKYLAFNDLIDRELGMRAEGDPKTALTQLWRRRDLIFGLVGGECRKCNTRQLPRSRYCINPECNALDSQEPFAFPNVPARVVTWSADHLSFTPDPPAYYGLIEFEGGGRMFANFGEIEAGELNVGSAMRMAFRIKEVDRKRNFRRYFWKAIPEAAPQPTTGE